MTVREHVTQVEALARNHGGPDTPLYWVDPATGERLAVQVGMHIGPDGVFIELQPVRTPQPVGQG